MKPRKDKPYEPVISKSECLAGLRLVRHILDGVVEHGDVPEQVVERALEFSSHLETLTQRDHVWPNAEDQVCLEAAILAGSLPTLRATKSA